MRKRRPYRPRPETSNRPPCPQCGSTHARRNGFVEGDRAKVRYRCNYCGHSYIEGGTWEAGRPIDPNSQRQKLLRDWGVTYVPQHLQKK